MDIALGITTRRCGDIAEMYVASRLLADPALEVFTTISDDGHGADLAVRSTRTGYWYAVQVKAATKRTSPFVYLKSFRPTKDYLVAAVVLDDDRKPTDVFLVPGTAWATDHSGCLGRNDGGGEAGPYVEVRTTSRKHASALAAYRFDAVCGIL